ncbi:FAD dependent oxidoreductase-domain-containing protein [Alternaria rosae]|uniref:FAD dependent oxidoreductase-domain-containing protein n=1 Tax=Alternaria rosae TaxID=1187941 RepID=UPI001E8DAC8C|nr:FAD dependent oxidoreductase-domain-containing protein [Alternaria rosae]KAH6875332.1 FAD dependent oxidoreductase-domain-containing protein [Alternaria rosae]
MGGAPGVALPETSTVLNAGEHASQPQSRDRTGFPKQDGQSLLYWLQQVRCDPLLNHRTTEELPQEADTVIVGSGITGTLVAKHHLETFPEKKVVVLEAREFCSDATGHNAGHYKPDQWRGYEKHAKAYGNEQAVKILENEQATWKALVAYVKENNVDCDLWVGETLDVPLDDGVAKVAKETFKRYAEAGGKVEHTQVIHNPVEAAQKSRIKSAKACYAWQTSTLQPWKLTAHVMRGNNIKGANIQTRTTAKSISEGTGVWKWLVNTERGDIVCDTVVHATNAYSAVLEPSLRGIITPKPHMCNRLVPLQVFSGSRAIRNSYSILLPDGAFSSINPRSPSDGNIMFGGSNSGQKELDAWVEKNPENCINDGLANLETVTKHARKLAESHWSGIIGLSADGVSFVGELPGEPGQYICAGHHGHGVGRIFTAAPGLVKLMNGEAWSATGLPEVY